MGQSQDERRRGDRIPINEEFSCDDEESAWVSDLSPGGVFVHSAQLLPVGSQVELRFTVLLDDPVVIEALGKIVRHSRRPQGMGVEFTSVAPEMTRRIEDALARQRPLDSGKPLRLPEPRREASEPAGTSDRVALARPAPIGDLSFGPAPTTRADDDPVTASFAGVASAEEGAAETAPKTSVFRPPPLPGAERPEVDEDDRTRQYPALERD
ncbi:PilZ domain protein [Enhygromyxa salina]|uniref:PilZ domain protein n=1 Tax=Enhygromyxa salina TaxID=215803 RepID=A0A2S9XG44_9BACT|nr:PilZ domain-containing protein [Enhygromyxa salina]PRP91730.1 PilZ domain protein [Enhygromyxa salina]